MTIRTLTFDPKDGRMYEDSHTADLQHTTGLMFPLCGWGTNLVGTAKCGRGKDLPLGSLAACMFLSCSRSRSSITRVLALSLFGSLPSNHSISTKLPSELWRCSKLPSVFLKSIFFSSNYRMDLAQRLEKRGSRLAVRPKKRSTF